MQGARGRDRLRVQAPGLGAQNSIYSCPHPPVANFTCRILAGVARPSPTADWRMRRLAIRVSISQRAHACATGSDDCRRSQTGRTITDEGSLEITPDQWSFRNGRTVSRTDLEPT